MSEQDYTSENEDLQDFDNIEAKIYEQVNQEKPATKTKPVIELNPEPIKTKRKYTFSDKCKAANSIRSRRMRAYNLENAQKVKQYNEYINKMKDITNVNNDLLEDLNTKIDTILQINNKYVPPIEEVPESVSKEFFTINTNKIRNPRFSPSPSPTGRGNKRFI